MMDPVTHVTLLLVISTNLAFSQELTGPNVCAESVTRRKTKQVEHTTYTHNCQGGQQTCSVTRSITVYYTDYESRQICCTGWIRNENSCLTPCPRNTYGQNCSGTCDCTSANSHCDPIYGCICDTGWKPPNCSEPCDSYAYGFACAKNCTCLNEATCDPVNGSCSCTPGWMDPDCSKACPADRFGANCLEECSCDTGVTCDRVTGNCILPEVASAVPEVTNNAVEDHRLVIIIVPLIVGFAVILSAVAGIMGHVIRRLNRRFRELKRKTEKGEHTRVADGNNASSSGNFPNVLWSQIAAHDLEERNVEYETTIGPSGSAVEAGSPIYFDADDKETDRRDYGSRSNPGNSKTQGCAETMDNIEHTYFMRDLDD